jgi:hypothetical protein
MASPYESDEKFKTMRMQMQEKINGMIGQPDPSNGMQFTETSARRALRSQLLQLGQQQAVFKDPALLDYLTEKNV